MEQINKADLRRLSSVRRSTPADLIESEEQPLLPAAITGAVFLPALERLCSSKNTVTLTPHASETWVSALSMYAEKPQIVHRAIISLATSADPFPDLGKLLACCERIRRELEGTMPQDSTQIKFTNVAALAKAWGLQV